MKYKYYFHAILCDRFCCNLIKACDLGIDGYGKEITISFTTNAKPTQKNIDKFEKLLNSSKNEKRLEQYYANAKFERVEILVKEMLED